MLFFVLGLSKYGMYLFVLRLKCGKMKLCYLTTQMVRNKGEQKRVCLEKGEREDGEGDVSMP